MVRSCLRTVRGRVNRNLFSFLYSGPQVRDIILPPLRHNTHLAIFLKIDKCSLDRLGCRLEGR